jgi:Uncharacterised nucleotidyltransferase
MPPSTDSRRVSLTSLPARRDLVSSRASADPQLLPPLGPVTGAVLFHGVEGAPRPPSEPDAWHQEMPLLLQEGLAGWAIAALDGSGADVDPTLRAELTLAHRAEIAMSRVAQAWAPDAIRQLHEDGVDSVVVKGPAVAKFYPRPGLRPFEDVDLLVPTECFRAAMDSLALNGFFRPVPPRGYFPLLCREGVNVGRADGASIDLHHRIPPWAFTRRMTFDRISQASIPLDLGRGVVRAASAPHNLLIAALQIIGYRAGPSSKLKAWRDVHQLAGHCEAEDAAREARDLNLDWYLALVLRQMPSYARPTALFEAVRAARPTRAQMARLRRMVPPAMGSRNYSLGRLYRLPPANGLAYLAAKVLPSQEFLRDMYGSRWAYARWWHSAHEHLMDSAGARPL